MEDSVLIAGTALMFLFGWVLMKRLDRFLDENQKRIKESSEQQQAEPCVHLVGNISPDELEETFSQFRNSHAHVEIVIYDSEQISLPLFCTFSPPLLNNIIAIIASKCEGFYCAQSDLLSGKEICSES